MQIDILELFKLFGENRSSHFGAAFNRVIATHKNIGFNNGDNILCLTDFGIACQGLGIGFDAIG